MGFRFRKSIKLGKNLRINLSKSGIGFSAGVKGARVSVGPKGVRKTASIPGTGISYTEQKSWNQINKSDENKGSKESYIPNESIPTTKKSKKPGCGCFTIIFVIILFAIISSSHSGNTSKNVSSNSTGTTVETKQDVKNTDTSQSKATNTTPINKENDTQTQQSAAAVVQNSSVAKNTDNSDPTQNVSSNTSVAPAPTSNGETQYIGSNGQGLIKGHIDSKGVKIYHLPGDPYYNRTTHVSEWFKTESEAQAAGYRHILK